MTTQEMLAKHDKTIKALESQLSTLSQSVENHTQTINQINSQNNNKFNAVKTTLEELTTIHQLLAHRLLALEQSMLSSVKILTAVIEDLKSKEIINTTEIMNRVRLADEEKARKEIDSLTKAGLLAPTECISSQELIIVVAQTQILSDGAQKVLSEYRIVDLKSPTLDGDTIGLLMNKKVGDEVSKTDSSGNTLVTKVVAIYEAKEVKKTAESDSQEGNQQPESSENLMN